MVVQTKKEQMASADLLASAGEALDEMAVKLAAALEEKNELKSELLETKREIEQLKSTPKDPTGAKLAAALAELDELKHKEQFTLPDQGLDQFLVAEKDKKIAIISAMHEAEKNHNADLTQKISVMDWKYGNINKMMTDDIQKLDSDNQALQAELEVSTNKLADANNEIVVVQNNVKQLKCLVLDLRGLLGNNVAGLFNQMGKLLPAFPDCNYHTSRESTSRTLQMIETGSDFEDGHNASMHRHDTQHVHPIGL